MGKVLYLLGAGASANALPIVSKIKESLAEVLTKLHQYRNIFKALKIDDEINAYNVYEDFRKELEWLQIELESGEHATIDTWAKKLKLRKEQDNYERLMNTFELLMCLIQVSKPIDSRYETWYASILNELHIFPSNLSIYSWNYDNQIELSYSRISQIRDLTELKQILNIQSLDTDDWRYNQFKTIKLNGSFFIDNTFHSIDLKNEVLEHRETKSFLGILNRFDKMRKFQRNKSSIQFAWDAPSIDSKLKKDLADVEEVVVIGYSFPHFNHKIDNSILWNAYRAERIVIQTDTEESFMSIKSKLLDKGISHLKQTDIVPVLYTDMFYISNKLQY